VHASTDLSLDVPVEALRHASPFLSVPELAGLLHLNEKKIYQLAGEGVLPGTKITGKWLFPRTLIERWLIENSHGGVLADRLLIAGSDDRLVHRVCSRLAIDWQRSALLAYCPAGTRHGLSMLDAGRVDACFINWGAREPHARRHVALLRGYRNHASWTVVRCFERTQGFILGENAAARHPAGADEPHDRVASLLHDRTLRWALRGEQTGTGRTLADACAEHDVTLGELHVVERCHSERAAAALVNVGAADIAPGVQSVAREYRLGFIATTDVAIDLVVDRRTFFRRPVQQLLERLGDDAAVREAAELGGYRVPERQVVMEV